MPLYAYFRHLNHTQSSKVHLFAKKPIGTGFGALLFISLWFHVSFQLSGISYFLSNFISCTIYNFTHRLSSLIKLHQAFYALIRHFMPLFPWSILDSELNHGYFPWFYRHLLHFMPISPASIPIFHSSFLFIQQFHAHISGIFFHQYLHHLAFHAYFSSA